MLRRTSCMFAAVAFGLAAGIACGDDETAGPAGPVAGTLVATLSTPNPDDGAILFRVSGPDITEVTRGEPADYFHFVEAGSSVTAVAVGELGSRAVLTFHVPDTDAVSAYSATVLDVADRNNELRGSLAGYELTIAPE
jgi:hypothetical protein